MSDDLVCVIMAGGAGTRFWPASTEARPKQLLKLFGEQSLLQMAYERAREVCPPERIYVLTSERFVGPCEEQLPELAGCPGGHPHIVGEPLRRDTAAAVALAVALCEAHHGDAPLAVLTADHKIEPKAAFAAALSSAAAGAQRSEAVYTFGIPPTYAATGYGYLELGEPIDEEGGLAHHRLTRFVEKPDQKSAEAYLARFQDDGSYLWNSGMFVFRAGVMAAELDRHLPAHLPGLRTALAEAGSDEGALKARLAAAFEPLEKVSIDVGVMEKAREVRALRAGFTWADVGSFPALGEHLPRDDDDNAARGGVFARDSHRNVVYCDDASERVALIGVDDLVVVRAGGRTLVCPKDRAEEIKQLVASLPPSER